MVMTMFVPDRAGKDNSGRRCVGLGVSVGTGAGIDSENQDGIAMEDDHSH